MRKWKSCVRDSGSWRRRTASVSCRGQARARGAGPLTGMEGIIVQKKKQFRFVVSLELIMRSVAVDISEGS